MLILPPPPPPPLSISASFYGYLELLKATRKSKKSKQGFRSHLGIGTTQKAEYFTDCANPCFYCLFLCIGKTFLSWVLYEVAF